MNIIFILESSTNSGGMERMLTTISCAIAKVYDVTVLTAANANGKDFFPFDKDVRRVDLGMNHNEYSKFKDFKKEYQKRLAKWLTDNRQDITVSLGSSEYSFLPDIKDGSKKIFWFHFAFNYDLMTSHTSRFRFVNLMVGHLRRMRRLKIAKRYDMGVVLSKSDYDSWRKHIKNVTYIYNPITIEPKTVIDYGVRKAMAVGRVQPQKGFDYLVEAWELVHKKYRDWQLDIYGGGSESNKSFIQKLIDSKGLHDVVKMKGITDDMAEAYSTHSIMVLSSRYEGFGLVLVEAAACGLPLVSYDCEQGPSEIIDEGKNGYLVSPVGNIKGLVDTICKLIQDGNLRKTMGAKAKQMSEQFSLEIITKEWIKFFKNLK